MSDNSFSDGGAVERAGEPAPEQGAVATPESVKNEAPQGEGSEESPEPKTFTQEELDKIVQKERAKAERAIRREMAQAPQEPQGYLTGEPPDPKSFKTALEYAEAKADFLAEEKLARREYQQRVTTVDATYADREEAARDKYTDFDDVIQRHPKDGGPAISEFMAEAIKESEMGPEIAYYLGKNPKESHRIWDLSPLAQAREIGKIEASLTANPPAKKASSAPDPITPVRRGTTTQTYDTTDPRSTKTMTASEWIEAERRRQAKKLSTQ